MVAMSGFANEFVEVSAAHGEIMGAVMQRAVALLLEQLRVLLVVGLLQLVLRVHAMAVQTVASRRQTARAMLAVVVTAGAV